MPRVIEAPRSIVLAADVKPEAFGIYKAEDPHAAAQILGEKLLGKAA